MYHLDNESTIKGHWRKNPDGTQTWVKTHNRKKRPIREVRDEIIHEKMFGTPWTEGEVDLYKKEFILYPNWDGFSKEDIEKERNEWNKYIEINKKYYSSFEEYFKSEWSQQPITITKTHVKDWLRRNADVVLDAEQDNLLLDGLEELFNNNGLDEVDPFDVVDIDEKNFKVGENEQGIYIKFPLIINKNIQNILKWMKKPRSERMVDGIEYLNPAKKIGKDIYELADTISIDEFRTGEQSNEKTMEALMIDLEDRYRTQLEEGKKIKFEKKKDSVEVWKVYK